MQVSWMPYDVDPAAVIPRTKYQGLIMYRDIIEPYMPSRVVRQLGRVQSIPLPIIRPDKECRAANTRKYKVEYSHRAAIQQWGAFPISGFISLDYFPLATVDPSACADDYHRWYAQHSHPFLLPGVRDDVRHPRGHTDYVRFSSIISLLLFDVSVFT